ncbi:Serine-threonine/tyrosine-protein kinase [Theobroma cacao]|nr:Serine-threonine/tyrosine-protein kinase [Theobroma cacao]
MLNSLRAGFTSIDCGIVNGYTDESTSLYYYPDTLLEAMAEIGMNANISDEYMTSASNQQLRTLRSFPNGSRNCYNLKVEIGKTILVRASFMYGNYDGLNLTPTFDLFLGVQEWTTVNFTGPETIVRKEIIHIPTTEDIDICLVKKGSTIPFISALELRPLPDSTYNLTTSEYLVLLKRTDIVKPSDKPQTWQSPFTFTGKDVEIKLNRTANSTHPPILNAVEIFMLYNFSKVPTERNDVEAIRGIRESLGVKKNWQGDPCFPADLHWDGVECEDIKSITTVNLRSWGLKGNIPKYFGNLTSIVTLDLSNNSLEGDVPDLLLHLRDLKLFNLSFNNLRGSVPPELIEKNGSDGFHLFLDGNPDLCLSGSCNKKRPVAAIVASVTAVVFVLLVVFIISWKLKRIRKEHMPLEEARPLESRNNQFTYSEVVSITNNFEKVIGKGGFGTVYYGCLNDDTEVAVKMLSESSNQGSEQFQAEAKLLMTVHHKNLTSLIGYCNDGTNMGLIYEYMTNGNLECHLKDRNRNSLGWEQRLKIAIDAAQGLEYLHEGIKPPVIHRDVKSSNILLDRKFHAKLADFGLSKAFKFESSSGVTTDKVCGTPGYLDPDFGVVLLEMITGQSAIIRRNNECIILVKWVTPMLERGDIQNILDQHLGVYDINSVWKAVDLAMTCVSSNPEARPNMSSTVMDLKVCLQMQMAWSKKQESRSAESIEIIPLNIGTGPGPSAR